MSLRNIKLTLEYDGTEYCGFQKQVKDRTVQMELERSLSMLTEETIKVTAAGRTDSGVHALKQTINFKTASSLPLTTFVRGGNSRLPRDVRILDAWEMPLDFSARYSARRRSYRYRITLREKAIDRQYAWYYWNPLDVMKMNQCCSAILGSHDFQSFCQSKAKVEHYLCDVRYAFWYQDKDEMVFEIQANRFLHHMVRIIVGTMVEIGDATISTSMTEILAARDRKVAGSTAPAHGLALLKVDY